ncbi:MAG TPA: two-component regulator propeller domain-containing protein, partial [Fibrella sp.]
MHQLAIYLTHRIRFVYPILFWLLSGQSQLLIAQLLPGKEAAYKSVSPSAARRFERLTLREGLETNYVMSIAQDTLGFIWLATVNGLTRFDGTNCRTFTRQAGNPQSLSHRIVRSVFAAKTGTLWVGTQEGLNRFEPTTQT